MTHDDLIGLGILAAALAILAIDVWLRRRRDIRRQVEHAAAESIRLYGPNLTAALKVADRLPVDTLFPDNASKGRWPDLCAMPPCDPEDRWFCHLHQPAGKHHADALTQVISIAEWKERIR